MESAILLWMLLVPGLAGLLCFVLPRSLGRLTQIVALGTAIWLLIAAVLVQGDNGLNWQWSWMRQPTLNMMLDLLVTPFGAIIALFIAFFGVLVVLYTFGYTMENISRHMAYMVWALGGAIGVALANNLIFLLLCWEVVTLMLFLLINQGGQEAKAGAAKTFAILGLSDCALLLGIVMLPFALAEPTFTMSQIRVVANTPWTVCCFLLFAVAAFAKAGAMPLHTWIPTAAEKAPTDVMAFLPASIDKLLGIYLLVRVYLQFFSVNDPQSTYGNALRMILLLVGAITICGAGMMALVQDDLKKLLSYCAVSQVGYILLGIGTGTLIGLAGAVFHMINHAIYKSCLFLTAGSIEKQTGSTNLNELGGLAKLMPFSFLACVIAALAVSGVPPLNGFSSKWMIYQAALEVPGRGAALWVTAAIFGSALTLAGFVKVIHCVFLGAPSERIIQKRPGESSFWMTGPMLVLAGLCVIFGIVATLPLRGFVVGALSSFSVEGLIPFTEKLESGQINAVSTLWNPMLATGLLLLALGVGVLIFFWGRGFQIRRTRSYIGGEKLDPQAYHYNGTGFYNTVRELSGVRQFYQFAGQKAFDLYHVGGRLGGAVVGGLRRCQTGVISLYVSWVVLGLIIILIILLGDSGG